MNARRQWRYIRWARAAHNRERVRAFLLRLSQRLDAEHGPAPKICVVLDWVADDLLCLTD